MQAIDENAEAQTEAGADEAGAPSESQINVDAIRAEVEAVELGPITAKSDDEKLLLRYLRRRQLIAMEMLRIEEQTNALLKSMLSQVQSLDYVYTGQIQGIVSKMLEGKKTKSLQTQFGKVGFRTVKGGLVITDESKLMEEAALAAADHPYREFVEQVPTIRKAKINDYFKTTGEIPPGCDVKQDEEKFFVK